jgi:hypothetical protein
MLIPAKAIAMIILALTDIHARLKAINSLATQLRATDLLLLCGDITHFGHQREMADILQLIRGIQPAVLAVSGNCDHPDAEKYLVEEGLSLNGICKDFQGYALVGLSGSLPCPGRTPQEYDEEEFESALAGCEIPTGIPLLMVSHQPPFGTLNDQVSPGLHVGSKAIRNFIEKQQPLICFTGHIHEGTGIDHIGPTAVVNPGPAGTGSYVMAEMAGGRVRKLEIKHI